MIIFFWIIVTIQYFLSIKNLARLYKISHEFILE